MDFSTIKSMTINGRNIVRLTRTSDGKVIWEPSEKHTLVLHVDNIGDATISKIERNNLSKGITVDWGD